MKLLAKTIALGLVPLAVAIPATAHAATVTFEEKAAFSCQPASAGPQSSGGLTYSVGFYVCYYSPTSYADFPIVPPSTVMASGYRDTLFTLTGGGTFDLASVDLAGGVYSVPGAGGTDTTIVTGTLAGGGTVSTTLTVGQNFQTHALNWSNLSSVTFGELANSGYLAFDNLSYTALSGGVPEPATWGLMILGFGAVGGALRRRTRTSVRFA